MPCLWQDKGNVFCRKPPDGTGNPVDATNRGVFDGLEARPLRHHLALVEHQQVICEFGREVQVVKDGKHDAAGLCEAASDLQH